MNKPDWDLLRRLIGESMKTLQDGSHATGDEWDIIASDLERAARLARSEADRLILAEEAEESA